MASQTDQIALVSRLKSPGEAGLARLHNRVGRRQRLRHLPMVALLGSLVARPTLKTDTVLDTMTDTMTDKAVGEAVV